MKVFINLLGWSFSIGPSFANSVLKIPLLYYLEIKLCSGIHHLNVHIPNVERFLVINSRDFDLSCFKTGTSVKGIVVNVPQVENSAPRKRISVPFADLKQLLRTLCLLRSVTNLRALVIQINLSEEDEEIVLKHPSRTFNCRSLNLWQSSIWKVKGLNYFSLSYYLHILPHFKG